MNDEQLNITVGARDEASEKLKGVAQSVGKVGEASEGIKDKIQQAGLAIATIGAGLTAYSKSAADSTVDYVRGVKTLSTQTGMAVDATSRLVYAFKRSGISTDEAQSSLGAFSKQIKNNNEQAAEAAGKQAEFNLKMRESENQLRILTADMQRNGDTTGETALKIERLKTNMAGYKEEMMQAVTPLQRLDIETKNADGSARSYNDILLDVADKFKAMPNGAEKSATAMELFGRRGKDLIAVLSQGRDGMQLLADQADKLGFTLSGDNVAKVDEYVRAQKDLKDKQQELTIAIGNDAIPMWKKLTEIQTAVVGSLVGLPEPLDKIATAFLAFGGPVLTALGTVLSFGSDLGAVSQSIPGVGKILSVLGGSFKALGGLMLGPVGAIIAVVAGVALLLDHFGLLEPMIGFVVEAAKSLWSATVELLKPAFDSIKESLIQLQPTFEVIITVLKYVAIVIGGIVVAAIIGFMAIVTALVVAVTATFAYIATKMVEFQTKVSNVFSAVSDYAVSGWRAISGAFRAGVDLAQSIWNRIGEFAGQVIAWFKALPGVVGGGISSMVDTIKGWIGTFFNSGKGLIDAFANGIKDAFGRVKDVVTEGLEGVRRLMPFSDAKEGPLSTLTLSGRRFSETFAAGITQGAPEMARAAEAAMSGLQLDAIAPAFEGAATVQALPQQFNTQVGQTNAASSGSNQPRTQNTFTGDIILQNASAVEKWFDMLDEDAELVARGMTPNRGAI